jgi:hypothetical protein
MASVRLRFSPGFLYKEDFPQINLLQRGGKRLQEERRGCSGGQRNKMRLLLWSSTALWRRVFLRELLRQYLDFCSEGNFPESKLSGFCSAVFEIHRAPQETGFYLLWRYSIHAEQRMGAGNSPLRRNPGLKRTRTDAILKKFKFKIILK